MIRYGPILSTVGIALLAAIATVHLASADGTPPATKSSAAAPTTKRLFVGTKKCRMCHSQQHRAWKKSSKGRSWKALLPGNGKRVKQAVGLDPAHDYSADVRCLPCHTVGFGQPGGYIVPEPDDGRSVRDAAGRRGAGCEACHGPGSEFVELMKQIYEEERTYRRAELVVLGRNIVEPQVCIRCHNVKALCVAPRYEGVSQVALLDRFRDDIKHRRGVHEAFPLKYRDPQDTTD